MRCTTGTQHLKRCEEFLNTWVRRIDRKARICALKTPPRRVAARRLPDTTSSYRFTDGLALRGPDLKVTWSGYLPVCVPKAGLAATIILLFGDFRHTFPNSRRGRRPVCCSAIPSGFCFMTYQFEAAKSPKRDLAASLL